MDVIIWFGAGQVELIIGCLVGYLLYIANTPPLETYLLRSENADQFQLSWLAALLGMYWSRANLAQGIQELPTQSLDYEQRFRAEWMS